MATLQCWRCDSPLPEAETTCHVCGTSTEGYGGTTIIDGMQPFPRLVGLPRLSALVPGMRVAGRYRILAPLSWGEERAIYGADDLKTGEAVALQFLPPEVAPVPEALAGWRRVSHPNVCKVLDLDESGGRAFLVLEPVKEERASTRCCAGLDACRSTKDSRSRSNSRRVWRRSMTAELSTALSLPLT